MVDMYIYSIRSFNNDKLVFYNYTKRKRIGDILSGYKTRFKRHLNNKDNWINVFYILKEDNSYIKIEEHIVNSNDEIVKSRLCEIIANNNCINKMRNEDIEKLCNKTEQPKTEIIEQPKIEVIEEVKEPIIIDEPKQDIKEPTIIEQPKTEVIEEVITEPETKIVKYIKEDVADISYNQAELLNDELIDEPTTSGIVNEQSIIDEPSIVNEPNIIDEPVKSPTTSGIIKVVKKLADVKCIDNVYEPSITSSSRYSRRSFKEQLEHQIEQQTEQLKHHNKTIKYNYSDVVKFINNKTLKKHKKDI